MSRPLITLKPMERFTLPGDDDKKVFQYIGHVKEAGQLRAKVKAAHYKGYLYWDLDTKVVPADPARSGQHSAKTPHFVPTKSSTKQSRKQEQDGRPGRKIKREFARTEFLKIRISKEHLDMLNQIKEAYGGITSQADIVERALEAYGLRGVYKGKFRPGVTK